MVAIALPIVKLIVSHSSKTNQLFGFLQNIKVHAVPFDWCRNYKDWRGTSEKYLYFVNPIHFYVHAKIYWQYTQLQLGQFLGKRSYSFLLTWRKITMY